MKQFKFILSFSLILVVWNSNAASLCFGEAYTQPPNSMCFSYCSSPPSGQTWTITYSGTYTINTPSSIAGTYTGNQSLTTSATMSEFCSNISITFTSGPSSATVASSNGTCGSRSESHTISNSPNPPTGSLLTHTINSGSCIDLTAQGRACSTGTLKWCSNSGSSRACTDITTPSNYCPASSVVVYAYCYNSSSGANCQNSSYEKDSIVVTGTTGNELLTKEEILEIYPNPANSLVNIKGTKANLNLIVMTLEGKVLIQKQTDLNLTTIDITSFNNGVYIVHVTGENVNSKLRFVKS